MRCVASSDSLRLGCVLLDVRPPPLAGYRSLRSHPAETPRALARAATSTSETGLDPFSILEMAALGYLQAQYFEPSSQFDLRHRRPGLQAALAYPSPNEVSLHGEQRLGNARHAIIPIENILC